ncbi:MAG TPA: F0F1 ATP synthase subunit delta [Burkholderiaceae bacterium]|nr:F0F1 ATP synthase subunit delta [Burkholderiaceae bacterium]
MAEVATIARPYAEAAFSVARSDAAAMSTWSAALGRLAAIAADDAVQALYGNPSVGPDKLAKLFCDAAGGGLTGPVENFVKLLAENGRLSTLPEIATRFEALRNAANATLAARVETAFALSAAEQAEIKALLEKKYGQAVTLTTEEAKGLIGGVRISIGDEVIDASVSGKLAKMTSALMN